MIDPVLVTRKISLIAKDLTALGPYSEMTLEDYLADPVHEVVVERYLERTIGRLFTGPSRDEMNTLTDLCNTEMLAAGLLTTGTIILGVFPAFLLQYITPSLASLSRLFS